MNEKQLKALDEYLTMLEWKLDIDARTALIPLRYKLMHPDGGRDCRAETPTVKTREGAIRIWNPMQEAARREK